MFSIESVHRQPFDFPPLDLLKFFTVGLDLSNHAAAQCALVNTCTNWIRKAKNPMIYSRLWNSERYFRARLLTWRIQSFHARLLTRGFNAWRERKFFIILNARSKWSCKYCQRYVKQLTNILCITLIVREFLWPSRKTCPRHLKSGRDSPTLDSFSFLFLLLRETQSQHPTHNSHQTKNKKRKRSIDAAQYDQQGRQCCTRHGRLPEHRDNNIAHIGRKELHTVNIHHIKGQRHCHETNGLCNQLSPTAIHRHPCSRLMEQSADYARNSSKNRAGGHQNSAIHKSQQQRSTKNSRDLH